MSSPWPTRTPVYKILAFFLGPISTVLILVVTFAMDAHPFTVLLSAFFGGGIVFWTAFIWGIKKDRERQRRREQAVHLRGPQLVSAAEFNRLHGSDGLTFTGDRMRAGRREVIDAVSIPRALEPNHILIMGDTGMGKSVLIRQTLVQIAERSETAIVYDPALEYMPQFYDRARGDVILNPLDVRMPYWSPGDEVGHEAETVTLAKSVFPDRPHENRFFTETSRKIFARLLEERPTAEELTHWLCHPEEIDRRVKGTHLEAVLEPSAPAQRAGVLASLNLVADALKLLPPRFISPETWSSVAWSKERRGWIFLTSAPGLREALLPLTSWWLDTLVLRLMTQSVMGGTGPRVWFVLDELASLQRLPQLHTALTENRKSGNPVVIGLQGRAQLEARYGDDAEVMLSQPATKIFLRTSEPRAAKWVSDTIGDVEVARLRQTSTETASFSSPNSSSETVEQKIESLVMPSEISGLPALRGYMKCGNYVVYRTVGIVELPNREPGFIPHLSRREMEEMARIVATATPADEDEVMRVPTFDEEPPSPLPAVEEPAAPEPPPRPSPPKADPFFE
jgi:type IV secretory pathway TraG/TraD family ATPase VirD4